jgi:hypothetical protein
LEQINLSLVLQGIETYAKTGLLVMEQEGQWVELYFRDGRLMCIGPVNDNTTLGDRLLEAGIISQQALQDALLTIGEAQLGETRVALTLMELGHVSHEGLRTWAAQEASNVLKVLLTWRKGNLYFEEGQQPPADRLLVALSCMSLLPFLPQTTQTTQTTATTPQPQRDQIAIPQPAIQTRQGQQISQPLQTSQSLQSSQPAQVAPITPPTSASFQSASQTVVAALSQVEASFASPVATVSSLNLFSDQDIQNASSLTPPQPISTPLPPMMVDTSGLRPDTVLMPVDVSSLREQNPQLPLTPERWRLLTRVDGRTTLQQACYELAISVDLVCQTAGELIALGLVQPMTLQQAAVQELSPVSRELLAAGLGNGHVPPGYAAAPAQPWLAVSPTTDSLPPAFQSFSSLPFETQSQWGNGGNGATFVPGRGWITTPQPLQPLQPSGPLYFNGANGMYAPVNNGR